MHILFDIEKVFHADHKQECAAKCCNARMGFRDHPRIFIWLPYSEFQRRNRICPHGDRNDCKRKNDAHAEDGNDDTPGQKPMLPLRRHITQNARINDRIIE
ncbi:hypothetical protein D9M72_622780 [compost metagenome]